MLLATNTERKKTFKIVYLDLLFLFFGNIYEPNVFVDDLTKSIALVQGLLGPEPIK